MFGKHRNIHKPWLLFLSPGYDNQENFPFEWLKVIIHIDNIASPPDAAVPRPILIVCWHSYGSKQGKWHQNWLSPFIREAPGTGTALATGSNCRLTGIIRKIVECFFDSRSVLHHLLDVIKIYFSQQVMN